MDRIWLRGGNRWLEQLRSGLKNAALLLAASLLTSKTLRLTNLPNLADITTMVHLLAELGVSVSIPGEASNDGHAARRSL